MTRGEAFASRLEEIAALAADLPDGAQVTVEWADAAPDLMLAIALFDGGSVRTMPFSGTVEIAVAECQCHGMVVRARCISRTPERGRTKLTLVKS